MSIVDDLDHKADVDRAKQTAVCAATHWRIVKRAGIPDAVAAVLTVEFQRTLFPVTAVSFSFENMHGSPFGDPDWGDDESSN